MTEFKLDLERPIDIGIRSLEAGEHGKKRSREIEHTEWKAVFDKIKRESPELSKAEAHRMVAGRFEVTESAVKKAIWRLENTPQT